MKVTFEEQQKRLKMHAAFCDRDITAMREKENS